MQHTENYNLNLFEPGDPVLAENFNANTQTIDYELATRLHGATFEYTGTGERSRVLRFSHRPLVVFMTEKGGGTRQIIAQWGNGYVHVLYYAMNAVQQQTVTATWNENTEEGVWELTLSPGGNYTAREAMNDEGTIYRCTAIME